MKVRTMLVSTFILSLTIYGLIFIDGTQVYVRSAVPETSFFANVRCEDLARYSSNQLDGFFEMKIDAIDDKFWFLKNGYFNQDISFGIKSDFNKSMETYVEITPYGLDKKIFCIPSPIFSYEKMDRLEKLLKIIEKNYQLKYD